MVEKWNLRRYYRLRSTGHCNSNHVRFMQFSTEVKSAHWQESSSTWLLQMSRHNTDGSRTDFTDECDVLLHATGVLNNFKLPEIKGIEKFKGKVIHTARWPEEYQQDKWKQEHVAVIGSGASSVQTVPSMQVRQSHQTTHHQHISTNLICKALRQTNGGFRPNACMVRRYCRK